MESNPFVPTAGDALLVIDVQNDFLPGGSLGIPSGLEVVAPLNRWMEIFASKHLPVFLTRDWHPNNHCSFLPQGGPWPAHCVADSPGAQFPKELKIPPSAVIVSKAGTPEHDAYSGFDRTDLNTRLQSLKVNRLFIGGLATDYCVLQTVSDGIKLGYQVFVLHDAIQGVNVNPEDEQEAKVKMLKMGALPTTSAILNKVNASR